MDASLIQKVIDTNKPFRIRTAAGDTYEVPHRDFISFSRKKTTVFVSTSDAEGNDSIAYIPLLTVTSVEAAADASTT